MNLMSVGFKSYEYFSYKMIEVSTVKIGEIGVMYTKFAIDRGLHCMDQYL